jgi:hypothetical protein
MPHPLQWRSHLDPGAITSGTVDVIAAGAVTVALSGMRWSPGTTRRLAGELCRFRRLRPGDPAHFRGPVPARCFSTIRAPRSVPSHMQPVKRETRLAERPAGFSELGPYAI